MMFQQQRPQIEQDMPEWRRDALDRERAKVAQNINENPAIWQKLAELESKIDRLLKVAGA